MNDPLKTSALTTCAATLSATSSPESASGATPCERQAGPTTDGSGQAVARANLSPRQAKAAGLLTSGTSGRTSTTSSASAALMSCLESRLRARTASLGSTLYSLTWKRRDTPQGRSICALRASAPRTSAKDSTGWPTPTASLIMAKSNVVFPKKTAKDPQVGLADVAAHVVGWPTPTQTDSLRQPGENFTTKNITLNHAAVMAGWPTPVANDDNKTPEAHLAMKQRMGERDGTGANRTAITSLQVMAKYAGWTTPSARDWKDTPGMSTTGTDPDGSTRTRIDQLPRQAAQMDFGATLTGSPSAMGKSARLNPELSRWLMGLLPVWCLAAPPKGWKSPAC